MNKFMRKSIIIFFLFLSVFIVLLFTKLPAYFDSYVYIDNYKFVAHISLIIYRFIMYFSFPIIIAFYEWIKSNKTVPYKKFLVENFNVLFCTYSLIAALYAIFGIDKLLGVDVFGNADTFLFVTGFIFTTIINKGIPDLIKTT